MKATSPLAHALSFDKKASIASAVLGSTFCMHRQRSSCHKTYGAYNLRQVSNQCEMDQHIFVMRANRNICYIPGVLLAKLGALRLPLTTLLQSATSGIRNCTRKNIEIWVWMSLCQLCYSTDRNLSFQVNVSPKYVTTQWEIEHREGKGRKIHEKSGSKSEKRGRTNR